MKISVIIPVYNAEKYVRNAVESALQQEECGEVILVEDGSPDNALNICRSLSKEYKNVFLYQHDNHQNKGPSPSRNLGATKAKFEYISFLDADDIYLPGRFKKALELLSSNSELDGIYEPVGSCFENEEAKKRFFSNHSTGVAMVTKKVAPENLFEYLISGKYGYIHLNGLLLKKQAFFDVGMFPDLRLHEDTILIFKLSLSFRLAPGETKKPVSMRMLHLKNTITKPGIDFLQSYFLYFANLLKWMIDHNINKGRQRLVRSKYYYATYRLNRREGKLLTALSYYTRAKFLSYFYKTL